MRDLKDAKNIYDHIVVPEELDDRLRETLKNAPESKKKPAAMIRFVKLAGTCAAAFVLCFTIGLNTSEVFAMEASQLPVIGSIAKVLTIRSYETKEDVTTTKVDVPEIQVETDKEPVKNAITDVNAEIQILVDKFTAEKEIEIQEYKEAFFATGGTEEEWNERSIDVNVSYEVKHQSNTTLSLLVDAWISMVSYQEERHFYNIDLVSGKELTLKDLLGEDAYEYASECVLTQMHEMIEAEPDAYIFWGVNDNGEMNTEYKGVKESTPFYINEAGNVVISFDKYEVGPGYMGIQEFEIPAR